MIHDIAFSFVWGKGRNRNFCRKESKRLCKRPLNRNLGKWWPGAILWKMRKRISNEWREEHAFRPSFENKQDSVFRKAGSPVNHINLWLAAGSEFGKWIGMWLWSLRVVTMPPNPACLARSRWPELLISVIGVSGMFSYNGRNNQMVSVVLWAKVPPFDSTDLRIQCLTESWIDTTFSRLVQQTQKIRIDQKRGLILDTWRTSAFGCSCSGGWVLWEFKSFEVFLNLKVLRTALHSWPALSVGLGDSYLQTML